MRKLWGDDTSLKGSVRLLVVLRLTISRRGGRFPFLAFTFPRSKKNREDGKDRRVGSIVRCAKKRGDIEAGIPRRFPRDRWSNDKPPGRIAPNSGISKARELHLDSHLQALIRKQDRRQRTLRESIFTAAIAR